MTDPVDDLADTFRALGAQEPEMWARSEIRENIAQLARFLVLRDLWPTAINAWDRREVIERSPAGKRLLDAGADAADLGLLLRGVAYETVFTVLDRIDDGCDVDARRVGGRLPGWRLIELDADPPDATLEACTRTSSPWTHRAATAPTSGPDDARSADSRVRPARTGSGNPR